MRTDCFPWLLVSIGAVVYANSLRGSFIYDDFATIIDNEAIRSLWPPLWLARAAVPEVSIDGRPVVGFTLAINYALGGLDPRGYHLVNTAVHILCALVLFGVVRRTLAGAGIPAPCARSAGGIALACALLWMVHPLQTECVNYLSQRTESIMGLCYLLTLYCAIRAAGPDRRAWWNGAAILACATGMASKEVMCTAPLMVLLYDRTFQAGSFARAWAGRRSLYTGLAATWAVLAALLWPAPHGNTIGFSAGLGPLDYAANQCVALVDYLRLVFWPHPLVLDYGFPVRLGPGAIAPHALVLAALLAAALAALHYKPALGFPGVFFFWCWRPLRAWWCMPSGVR